jgi:hypothetical protein
VKVKHSAGTFLVLDKRKSGGLYASFPFIFGNAFQSFCIGKRVVRQAVRDGKCSLKPAADTFNYYDT